jgi:hypothetical protein
MKILNQEIATVASNFKNQSNPEDRYTSFDYCYNHFKQTKDLTQDMEKSCLTLAFYLASWGMLRGSSFLLQKSARHYQSAIEYINGLDKSYWGIDVDSYSEENMEKILDVYANLRRKLIQNDKTTHLTLITKVALGVFGFIPAYDQYFVKSFKELFKKEKCGFSVLNKTSLTCIKTFYDHNQDEIDRLANSTFTTDFTTGNKTIITYPKAKIIDMYGFTAGLG